MYQLKSQPLFLAETCTVSTEVACAGQPHRYWSDQQALLANTVVCGSPNEVANSPDAPVAATNAYQFQGGTFFTSRNNPNLFPQIYSILYVCILLFNFCCFKSRNLCFMVVSMYKNKLFGTK